MGVGPAAAGGVALSFVPSTVVAGGAAVAGCSVTTGDCDAAASNVDGCSPEVAGGAAVLVDPYDPDAIAGAIMDILNNNSLRQTLVERGLQRVHDFSWDKSARDTLALFECVNNR